MNRNYKWIQASTIFMLGAKLINFLTHKLFHNLVEICLHFHTKSGSNQGACFFKQLA